MGDFGYIYGYSVFFSFMLGVIVGFFANNIKGGDK